MASDKIKQAMSAGKDIAALAGKLNAKIDTAEVTLSGYSRSNIGREMEIVGKLFSMKKGETQGPLTGNYGAYAIYITDIMEAPAKENFASEKMQAEQGFSQRAASALYSALEKSAKISDNRLRFY